MDWRDRILMFAAGIFSIAAIFLVLAIVWRYFAFKLIFQFLTSCGFIFIGFYYFLRTRVQGNVQKGFLFIAMSPVVFFLSELFFFPFDVNFSQPGFSISIWDDFLNVNLYKIGSNIKTWHVLTCFCLFANAIALARRPIWQVFVAVNLVSVLATTVIFLQH